MNPGSTPAYAGNSLVYDGGFERDISGGGFGWRQSDVAGADFDFDTDEKHSGSRSARLIFDGTQESIVQGFISIRSGFSGDPLPFSGISSHRSNFDRERDAI